MARYTGEGVRDLMALAEECPLVWLQLHEDWMCAYERQNVPQWREPGEKPEDARDRLRREREEAKRRIEESRIVHDRGSESGRDS